MSDDGGGLHERRTPPRTGQVQIADFTVLVRVPGRPAAVRVFTAAEQEEAAKYASENAGVVVQLPIPPPKGYTADSNGNLIRSVALEADRAPA